MYTIDLIGRKLTNILSPILPHLSTEYCIHHPRLRYEPEKAVKQQLCDNFEMIENNFEADKEIVTVILKLRSSIMEKIGSKGDISKLVIFHFFPQNFDYF